MKDSKLVPYLRFSVERCQKLTEEIEKLERIYRRTEKPKIAGVVDSLIRILGDEAQSLISIVNDAKKDGEKIHPFPYLYEQGLTASDAFDDWKNE
jgi:hypothetical protein